MLQNISVFPHVGGTHVLGQTGRCRLNSAEFLRILSPISQRKGCVEVKIRGFDTHLTELLDGELSQDFASLGGLAHIHLDQAAIGLIHIGQRLTRFKVNNRGFLHRLVWFAPADDGNLKHLSSLSCDASFDAWNLLAANQ